MTIRSAPRKGYTQNEFIASVIKIHGNRFSFDHLIYKNIKTKVAITCSIHGDFLIKPSDLLHGQGCKECFLDSLRISQEEFINKVKTIHGNKYFFDKSIYNGCHTKLTVECPHHGKFLITPSKLFSGQGCKQCASSYTQGEFIELCQNKFGNKFDYSLTKYLGCHSPIYIKCAKGHVFKRSATYHLRTGLDCPICARLANTIELINQRFDTRYNIPDFRREDDIIDVICPKHGSFQESPKNLKRGIGCQECKREKLQTDFITRSKEIYGDYFDYSRVVYKKYTENVVLVCKRGHVSYRSPSSHAYAFRGCNICVKSDAENVIAGFLNKHKVYFKREMVFDGCISIKSLRFDFFIPDLNVCIEYDGIHHFVPIWGIERFELVKKHDQIKTNFCRETSIHLIRICRKDFIIPTLSNLIYPINI